MKHLNVPFYAYKGAAPYIFVSYAHKDEQEVFPIIKKFHEAGYLIWYDEGIDPGNEWPLEIEQALKKCSLFLVFITPNSVGSRNVRNEINYALSHNLPFLAIYLEETELIEGLGLQMGSTQAIMKYRMDEEAFYYKSETTFQQMLLIPADDAAVAARTEQSWEKPPAPKKNPVNANKKRLAFIAGGIAVFVAVALISALFLKLPDKSANIADSGAPPKIVVDSQKYEGEDIVEILKIACDGDNKELEDINDDIKTEINRTYRKFTEKKEEGRDWIEIRSYPFTSADYLQIVTTHIIYPTYGTDGEIYSYNYSIKKKRRLSVEDAMNEFKLSESELFQRVKDLFEPEYPTEYVGKVQVKGFLLDQNSQLYPQIVLLLQVVIENPDAPEPRATLFSYTPHANKLAHLNGECVFDPTIMDSMNPPLSYSRK